MTARFASRNYWCCVCAVRDYAEPECRSKAPRSGLGFWHLNYFVRDYKAHFGDSPSETLARR